jgi:hypothetical protein
VPESQIYHKLSSTMGPHLTPERVYLGEKNRLQALLKNLDVRRTVLGIFVSGGYTVARHTISLQPKTGSGVGHTWRGFLGSLPSVPNLQETDSDTENAPEKRRFPAEEWNDGWPYCRNEGVRPVESTLEPLGQRYLVLSDGRTASVTHDQSCSVIHDARS